MSEATMSRSLPVSRSIVNGVLGGLAGGVVFGILMAAQNMLPMVGMLIGQENAVIGAGLHMVISAFIGLTFGFVAPRLPQSLPVRLVAGGAYGIIWWVLGALVLMPLMLGMNAMVLQIGDMQIMSLIGHIIFGVILGGVYHALTNRS